MFKDFLAVKAEIREDGSIQLPKDFLKVLGWTPKTVIQIEFEQKADCLVVTAPYDFCCLCGTSENPFFSVMGKFVCEDCQQMVAEAKVDTKKIAYGKVEEDFYYKRDE